MTEKEKNVLLASLKTFQPIKPEFQPPKPLKISPRSSFASHCDYSIKTLYSAELWDHCPMFWSGLMHYFCTGCTKWLSLKGETQVLLFELKCEAFNTLKMPLLWEDVLTWFTCQSFLTEVFTTLGLCFESEARLNGCAAHFWEAKSNSKKQFRCKLVKFVIFY